MARSDFPAEMLLDAVLLYNAVSSISRREQTVKLNQEGFEVFREYYPAKEEDSIVLECIWQRDKYVLVERKHKYEANSQERDVMADVPLTASKIQYENIEVLLGVDEPGTTQADNCLADPISVEEDGDNCYVNDYLHYSEIGGIYTRVVRSGWQLVSNDADLLDVVKASGDKEEIEFYIDNTVDKEIEPMIQGQPHVIVLLEDSET
ncbi:hypothetical protein OROHE_011104 [Orobanche hederae]